MLASTRTRWIPALAWVLASVVPSFAAELAPEATVEQVVGDAVEQRGLLQVWSDAGSGKIWLELPVDRQGELGRFLYVDGLLSGLGSNPLGLDRGLMGPTRLLVFRRLGNRVLVEQPNLSHRAGSPDPHERLAVDQSFARSVVWAAPIAARREDGRVLIDFTSFLLRDALGVARLLGGAEEGSYRLDPERSGVDVEACLVFPDNLEFETLLTWSAEDPGPQVRAVTPSPESITLVQHQSLIRLPDDGYRPRRYDPRAGFFDIRYLDYSSALAEPLERRFIVRHRLREGEALVYHVDRGVPEPVRSALVEGAGWWARAFEAAGWPGTFRVELLPEGAHPLDVRYHVIQWVHRSTRGWSYGGGVIDPRTGEMLKGHVRLGSLRVRQDRLLFEGLAGAGRSGAGGPDDPVQLALARIRQLAAHEVGHTLGLDHNFAASTYDGRASVMDYPAPQVRLAADGTLDFSGAYAVGVGSWDLQAIRYGYSRVPAGAAEQPALEALVRQGLEAGHVFLGDADARPPGAAHPLASLWDNGADAARELDRLLAVRRVALARFGEGNLAAGRPLGRLEQVLAPLYLSHRYQVEAAAKLVGGQDYRHAVAGDGQPLARPVPAADQRRALESLLAALQPAELDLSEQVLARLLPPPPGAGPGEERFRGRTAPVFDALGAAATAADLVLSALLQPERCGRMVDFHRRDPALPGLDELLDRLTGAVFAAPDGESARRGEIRAGTGHVLVERLIGLASDARASGPVRARVESRLTGMAADPSIAAPLRDRVRRWLARPETAGEVLRPAPPPPPGSPIGGGSPGCSRG